jgi:GTP-binding protein Era
MPESSRTASTTERRRKGRVRKGRLPQPAEIDTTTAPTASEEPQPSAGASPQRCGFIALIGAPNVGKSTLINALVGSKIAIVSHKVQTTRSLLRGIATAGRSQLIFIDTPGIFAPKRRLDRAMVRSAWTGAQDADVIALILDAKRAMEPETLAILDQLSDLRRPKILLINKIDLVDKPLLLETAGEANKRAAFVATFMISALTGDGVADVKNWLAAHVPEGPWHYPEDQITDAPLRALAAEITREEVYLRLHQEIPYQSTVETDKWEERRDGSIRIEQTIYVERESQRKIVLGKDGRTIKAIGSRARVDIAAMVEAPVHLFLFVKVREGWGEDRECYRAIGLEFPKE